MESLKQNTQNSWKQLNPKLNDGKQSLVSLRNSEGSWHPVGSDPLFALN